LVINGLSQVEEAVREVEEAAREVEEVLSQASKLAKEQNNKVLRLGSNLASQGRIFSRQNSASQVQRKN
jgi:ElaB/YqjD/DUF883 family membrane-anchored ribosome-binding protein